jgi:hypothetical protein
VQRVRPRETALNVYIAASEIALSAYIAATTKTNRTDVSCLHDRRAQERFKHLILLRLNGREVCLRLLQLRLQRLHNADQEWIRILSRMRIVRYPNSGDFEAICRLL